MWTHRGLYAWRNTWICPIQVLSMPTLAFTKPPSNLGKHHFIKKLNFVPRFREKLGWRWVLRKSHSVFKENCTSEETSSQTQTSIAYDQQEWETEGRQGKCLKPFFDMRYNPLRREQQWKERSKRGKRFRPIIFLLQYIFFCNIFSCYEL